MPTNNYFNTPKGWSARLVARCKHRALSKNIVYELDVEWFRERINTLHCEVTGIPFNLTYWCEGKRKAFDPSIDRKIPSLGYTKENCQVVCYIYNNIKNEFSEQDVIKLAQSLISLEDN